VLSIRNIYDGIGFFRGIWAVSLPDARRMVWEKGGERRENGKRILNPS